MKRKIILITLFSMLFGSNFPISETVLSKTKRLSGETVFEEPKNQPANAKFALLVGVNKYTDPKITDLSGTENDVALISDLLAEVYKFNAKTDIRKLLTSNAKPEDRPTQKGIRDAFERHLIGNAKKYFTDNKLTSPDKGATVVFYYSGHGSHLPDDNGDEADGRDETIVPMDADYKGTKDIRDDEFDKWFSELKKYTSNITFIFDSCHSGTITRGAGKRSLDRPAEEAGKRGDGTDVTLNENFGTGGDSYVTISGSLPNQFSYEDLLPHPKTKQNQIYGYMTYFLTQSLRENPDATYRDVMKRVQAAVQKRNSAQTPQVEGDIDRAMFGSTETRGKRGILINNVKTQEVELDGQKRNVTILTIEAGKIVGAYPGGAVAIYKQIGDAEMLAAGEIIEAGDFNATVRVIEKEIPETAKIVLTTPFFGSNKRTVALDLTAGKNTPEKNDAGLKMIRRLTEKLEKSDYVTAKTVLNPLNEKQKDWNAAIVRSTYGEFKRGNLQPAPSKDAGAATLPKDADEIYYLANTKGDPLYNFWVKADENADAKIAAALEKFVRVENLKTLGNEASDMNQGLEFKIVKLKTLNTPPRSLSDFVEDGYLQNSILAVGDYFSFEISNRTGNALFAYIYSIGTDGSVNLLYEPKSDGDILQNNITIKTFNASKLAGLAIPPFGVETFKLIASSQRFDGTLLVSPAIGIREKGLSPLETLLAQASTNKKRSEVVSFEFSGWATTSLDVEVKGN